MDAYEATRIVFSRIQALDPENASKIMGLLLIQDHGEKEMIRLAFGPESLLHSVVFKARKDLGLSSASNGGLSISLSLSPTTSTTTTTTTTTNNNNSHHHNHHNSSSSTTPTTPSSPSPFFPNPISRQNSISSSRILSNLSPSSPSSWAPPNFPDTSSAAAAAAAAATSYDDLITINNHNLAQSDLMDEFQLHEQLSFLNEAGAAADATIFPSSYPWGPISSGSHRRSNSVTDICGDPLGTGGLGWKPCLYFARGYCKNGTSCRFLHGLPDEGGLVGSPTATAMEQCHQELLLLRSATKTHQQQQQPQQLRLGSNSSQLINSSSFPYPSGKCMNFLLQQQQQQQSDPQRAVSASAAAAAAALMLGEDVHKFGRLRIDRNEGMVNPGSRQIYLTFPADSTFREEDVSNYFSIYGPVQDVRIPYQQKRMFGFVTFVYPETVKLILAKGNPHFVCDARVLVKPYKEKGKVPDKYRKQQQQQQQQQQTGGERGDFSGCSTPTGIDSRDPYDLQQLGGRAFNSTQEMLRRKLEEQQVDLQQAIELQSRRFMGLQLLDVKKHHHQRNLSAGAVPIPSPTHHHHHNHHHHHPLISPHFTNGNHVSIFSQSVGADPDRGASPEGPPPPPPPPPQDQQIKNPEEMVNHNDNGSKGNGNDSASIDDCGFHSSLEHNLPDSPFASPKKSNGDSPSSISVVGGSGEGERSNGIAGSSALSSSSSSFLPSSNSNKNLVAASSLLPATSSLDIAPFKSCLLQVPRFSSGHGALGM